MRISRISCCFLVALGLLHRGADAARGIRGDIRQRPVEEAEIEQQRAAKQVGEGPTPKTKCSKNLSLCRNNLSSGGSANIITKFPTAAPSVTASPTGPSVTPSESPSTKPTGTLHPTFSPTVRAASETPSNRGSSESPSSGPSEKPSSVPSLSFFPTDPNDPCGVLARFCGVNGFCEVVDGVGVCSCNEGFKYDSPSRTCKDINECQQDPFPCGPDDVCVDTDGGFICVTPFPSLSLVPSDAPSDLPSTSPSTVPTAKASLAPSLTPSQTPSDSSMQPSKTQVPSLSRVPSKSLVPSTSKVPTISSMPSMTALPSLSAPSSVPSTVPSTDPSTGPSQSPSMSILPSVSMIPSVSEQPSTSAPGPG